MATLEVQKFDGVELDVQRKAKALTKFGRRGDLGLSKLTVSNLEAEEVYPTTDAITSIISGSGSDTTQARIEGHSIDGSGNLTFVVQFATLTGQTAVTLGTPLARCSRVSNNGADMWAGEISVYEGGATTAGIPDTAAEVHARILAGEQQSFKASTSISSSDYLILTGLTGSVLQAQNRRVDFFLEIRTLGGVFRPQLEWGAGGQGSTTTVLNLDPCLVVPANADVRITAVSSGTASNVAASFAGYLASMV